MRRGVAAVAGGLMLGAVLIVGPVGPAGAADPAALSAKLLPEQPNAGQAGLLTVRAWTDARHRHLADIDRTAAADALVIHPAGSAEPRVTVSFLKVDTGHFEGNVVFPNAGKWVIEAKPGVDMKRIDVRVLRAGVLPHRDRSWTGVIVILLVAAVSLAVPEVYFLRRRRLAREREAAMAADRGAREQARAQREAAD